MNSIRQQILHNRLELPVIRDLEVTPEIQAMFRAMWHRYIAKGPMEPTSMTYWAQRIANPKLHNQVLRILSDFGWITVSTRPNNNWSEAYINESKLLTYCTKDELDRTRMFYKFRKYKLELHEEQQDYGANVTSVRGKSMNTGLFRPGFAKAGKVKYSFDTKVMYAYEFEVTQAINKGIEKMIKRYPQILEDHANYKELGAEIVQSYIYAEDNLYNAGPRTSDQRGRDNRGDLSKIGNPVGFKVIRSLLVIAPEYRNQATTKGLNNKFLFIAELMGFKSGTAKAKADFGRQCYYTTALHTDPKEDEVAENIWLERTYADIDLAFGNLFSLNILKRRALKGNLNFADPAIVKYKWSVPIEIDMSASVLGFLGLLLNHKPFMERCNILLGELSDAWGHNVVTNRKQFKTAMRPLYGSQLSAQAMWNDMDIEYTPEEVVAFQHELNEGEFAVAVAFKDFLINNAQMTPEMDLVVNGEVTHTYCNRFHNVGETTTQYDLFDTATGRIRRIHNTQTKRIPDLQSFRRYGPTGLIHHLDGMVMDNTINHVINQYGFAIDIHDAIICCCESADFARDVYANGTTPDEPSLKQIHTNRKSILQDYIRSLNIPASAITEFNQVMAQVEPLTEPLIVNPLVLK